MAASTGFTRNAVGSSTWQRILITDVHGARELHGRPQREVQDRPDKLEVVASFCYLGDMLLAADGCELSTTTRVKTAWKMFKELLPVLSCCHLSFKTRGRVYSSCVRSPMLHASETWPLTKPNLKRLQLNNRGNDQTDLQCQATRHCHHQVQLATCTAWNYGSGPHSEGEKAPLVWTWNAPMVQSRQPVTYGLMENMGLGGPRWQGSRWQRGIAESGSSRLSTLMTDTPGDLVWDLPCVQQASYLEGGPLMWMLPLYLHINIKSDDDRSTSPYVVGTH